MNTIQNPTKTDEDPATPSKKGEDKVPETKPVTDADVKESAKVKAATLAVPLNTSEDAVMAYLREQIDEDALRQVVGRFGKVSQHWLAKEQFATFARKVPDDLVFDRPVDVQSHKDYLAGIEEQENERREAMEEALNDEDTPRLEKVQLRKDLEALTGKKPSEKK